MRLLTRTPWMSRRPWATRFACTCAFIGGMSLMGSMAANAAVVTYYYTGPTYSTVIENSTLTGTFTTSQRITGSLTFEYPTGSLGLVSITPIAFTFSNGRHTFSSDDVNVVSSFKLNFVDYVGWLVADWDIELRADDISGFAGSASGLSSKGDGNSGVVQDLGYGFAFRCLSDDCLAIERIGQSDSAYIVESYSDEQLRGFWVAAVSTPATVALLGIGLAGLGLSRRRQQ